MIKNETSAVVTRLAKESNHLQLVNVPVIWTVAQTHKCHCYFVILVCSCVQLGEVEEGMVCLRDKESFI